MLISWPLTMSGVAVLGTVRRAKPRYPLQEYAIRDGAGSRYHDHAPGSRRPGPARAPPREAHLDLEPAVGCPARIDLSAERGETLAHAGQAMSPRDRVDGWRARPVIACAEADRRAVGGARDP